jgi:hypothetical protein
VDTFIIDPYNAENGFAVALNTSNPNSKIVEVIGEINGS